MINRPHWREQAGLYAGGARVQACLLFAPSTARRLMIVAADQRLANRAQGHALPPSWRTLYELTRLDDAELEARGRDLKYFAMPPRPARILAF